jgi:phosphatidylglycerol---prolipoprotein diacylglyceryl transferase
VFRITAHPQLHFVFEALGYVVGFVAFNKARRRSEDVVSDQQRWTIMAAAFFGALVGSRLLEFLEQTPRSHLAISQLLIPNGGKTIVGGLLGGWLGVEIAKKFAGIDTRTGDLLAIPLCIGIGIGRLGCLMGGLADDTYGNPTQLPWGVDFGDGMPRHPTQAYEILFIGALGWALHNFKKHPHKNGALFGYFMAAYLTWRLLVDFLKPEQTIGGLNVIQWACIVGLALLFATRWSSRTERQYA